MGYPTDVLRSRVSWLRSLWGAFLLGVIAGGPPAGAQAPLTGEGNGHGEKAAFDFKENLDPETRQRSSKLERSIMCACPRENWSRTLSNCPDSCADPQKKEILNRIAEQRTDQQIFDFMRQKYGPRVMATPDGSWTSILTIALPIVCLLAFAGIAVLVLANWQRKGQVERVSLDPIHQSMTEDEVASIERELERFE